MCIKNYNSQTDSKVETCKECIDKKILDSISSCIGFFYVFLAAIPVSVVFIFYKTDTSIGRLFILLFMLAAYITFIFFYVYAKKLNVQKFKMI